MTQLTQNNVSFRVSAALTLKYDNDSPTAREYITRAPGEYVWWKKNEGGYVYFYDMDGNVGRLLGADYEELESDGLITMTDSWISREDAAPLCPTPVSEEGDALERLK